MNAFASSSCILLFATVQGSASLFTCDRRDRERERERRERESEDHLSHKSQQPGALFERRQVKNQKGIREEDF